MQSRIEFGSKYAMIAPHQKTYDYLEGRPKAPENYEAAVEYWESLYTDENASYDKYIEVDVTDLEPYVTWGTTPGMGVSFSEPFPEIQDHNDEAAYEYMDLKPGMTASDIPVRIYFRFLYERRLEDLVEEPRHIRKVSDNFHAIVVPAAVLENTG